ncbi:MAG: hypothetical protein Q9159_001098 [Coniocarpon cinnabarinum]
MTGFLDLPFDILLQVVQHLGSAQDFLALCTTCRELYDAEEFVYAPSFWSRLAREKFRVPNRPVVQADGRRWRSLYRRMLKETKVYVWGNNDRGSLGKPSRSHHHIAGRRFGPHVRPQVTPNAQANTGWPQELDLPKDVGSIADLQCGGWCTAALTSSGKIFVVGSLSDSPHTDGMVWKSSQLQEPTEDSQSAPLRTLPERDISVVATTAESPRSSPSARSEAHQKDPISTGAVVNWILLESFLVWVTDIGRVFATHIHEDGTALITSPLELTSLVDHNAVSGAGSDILDVQGSFRDFALLRANGEVLSSNQDMLTHLWSIRVETDSPTQWSPRFRKIRALQHTGVIQLAFGDWHFHALHRDGHITSYGKEMSFCGSLGLGDTGIDMVRGIKSTGFGGDGVLLEQCNTNGRRVFFENQMKEWMDHVRTGGKDKGEAVSRMDAVFADDEQRAEVSEWFECRLRDWDRDVPASVANITNDDGLAAFFALSVAAAGWHSGALVLQNDNKAAQIRKRYEQGLLEQPEGQSSILSDGQSSLVDKTKALVMGLGRSFLGLPETEPSAETSANELAPPWQNETFPRLRLKSGQVMEGQIPIEDWSCPEWKTTEYHEP